MERVEEDMKIDGSIPESINALIGENGITYLVSCLFEDMNDLAKKMGVQHELKSNQYILKRFRRLRELMNKGKIPEDLVPWYRSNGSVATVDFKLKMSDIFLYQQKDRVPLIRELWELTAIGARKGGRRSRKV